MDRALGGEQLLGTGIIVGGYAGGELGFAGKAGGHGSQDNNSGKIC